MIVHTKIKLPEEQTAALRQSAKDAMSVPAILLSQRHLGPHGKTEAELAQERWRMNLQEVAKAAGLPDQGVDVDGDHVEYGIDFETGELLGWAPDAEQKP